MLRKVVKQVEIEVCEWCEQDIVRQPYPVRLTRKDCDYVWCSVECFENDIVAHVKGEEFHLQYFALSRLEERRRKNVL